MIHEFALKLPIYLLFLYALTMWHLKYQEKFSHKMINHTSINKQKGRTIGSLQKICKRSFSQRSFGAKKFSTECSRLKQTHRSVSKLFSLFDICNENVISFIQR